MYFSGLSWVFIASHGLSLVVVSGGVSAVQGPLIAVVAVACCRVQASGLSGPEACGILADEGPNPCSLH